MQELKLPEPLKGQWIWMREPDLRQETHLFFRKDFSLSEMPGRSEMWITARTAFQLYINGQLCAAGPTVHPCDKDYVYCVDINYLVQLGTNQIAVQAFNSNTALANSPKKPGGFWAQLQIDGQAVAWTDDEWKCLRPDCYQNPGIILGVGAQSVEIVNFKKYPYQWQRDDCFAESSRERVELGSPKTIWYKPKVLSSAEESKKSLVIAPNAEEVVEICTWRKIAFVGGCRQIRQALWVNFYELSKNNDEGVYYAETYLHSEADAVQRAYCFCDSPYRMYLNDELVSEQAVEPITVHATPELRGNRRLSLDEYAPIQIELKLNKGWNRFIWLQDCAFHGAGMTMVWQDAPNGSILIRQQADEQSKEGWRLAGPLLTPLALSHPIISVDADKKIDYLLSENPAWDKSIALTAYNFASRKILPEVLREPTQLILDKQFVVFDFGRTIYGHPNISVQGSEGDTLEVVCCEHCLDGEVLSYASGKRNVSTLILSGKRDYWTSATPRGFRYIMLLGSSVRGKILVSSLNAKCTNRDIVNRGSFNSSDTVYNEIWDTGSLTLSSTLKGSFIDAPCRDQAQYISDAFIQSWSAYHLFGDYDMNAAALRSFALTQLETGELNSVSPSGLFQALPDYSMLWIVWLHRHMNYTADEKLFKAMLPAMEKLLNYYNRLAISPDGPIGDLRNYLGAYCFLDHDDIDRRGICTGLNGLYCRALSCAAGLVEKHGRSDLAEIYRARAATVANTIRSLCWDEEKGMFADAYHNNKRSEVYSWQSNVLALYGGIPHPANYERIWSNFFIDSPPYELKVRADYNNPYFKYFLLKVACALGKTLWALRFIRYYWGKMLDAGAVTWWELFDPDGDDQHLRQCSKCQGYAVSPNGFLISELVGIRPAGLGMQRVFFSPTPQACAWVKAQIPTPLGRLKVEWKKNMQQEFEVNISANYPVEIIPVLDPDIAEIAVFQVSDEVSILGEEVEEE